MLSLTFSFLSLSLCGSRCGVHAAGMRVYLFSCRCGLKRKTQEKTKHLGLVMVSEVITTDSAQNCDKANM